MATEGRAGGSAAAQDKQDAQAGASAPTAGHPRRVRVAVAALVFNAFAWGVSWWPFRELGGRGLHALWATVIVYLIGVIVITLVRPSAWGQLMRAPALWWLVLASGATNATFNWGVTIGDVVRVVLLFYLMPLWAMLLARVLLGEPFTRAALLRLAMALAGAAIVLWPPAQAGDGAAFAWPAPATLAEWLGLAGGFAFALTNVLLRREAAEPETARALAMFLGGALVAGALAFALASAALVPWPGPAERWALGVGLLALWFMASNLALQHGAARVPASVTAVVMVSEVVFASVSAVLLGASTVTPTLALGACLIVGASVLAARA
ncbi:MAG: DMT family transporter [Burkholderiales bacterium]|nr:DMT family transporter [Burkholderiales bacterium]